MKKIVKLTAFAVIAALSLNSCIEETFPEGGTVTGSQAAASSTALEAMVNAIPVAMVKVQAYDSTGSYHFDFGYPSLMMIYDNMSFNAISVCGDGNAGYNWFVYFCNGGGLGPDYSRTAYIWVSYFNFIKAANDVIYTITSADEIPTTSMSYLAAAKAYRAMLYLDLARLYDPLENDYLDISSVAELTLPYISESTTEDEARFNPRMTRDEMFDKIFADLDSAEELYTTEDVKVLSGTNPSLAVVYGLKARAYLWLGGFDSSYYTDAATYARKAIEESGCTITSKADYCSTTAGFNTPTNAWMWYLPQSADATSNLLNYVAWMSSEADYGYGSLVAMGIQSSNYDRISDTDFRKDLFLSGSPKYADYASVTLLDEAGFSAMFPYAGLKFRPLGGSINDYTAGNATSIPLMRVEEMYLIEAEATAHSSAASGASLLNSFMSERDSSYSFSSTSSEKVVEEILFQKGIELWGEGLYLFDAKRMGLGISSGYSGTNVASDCLFNIEGVAPWWNPPFPTSEIIQNTALDGFNNPDPSEFYTMLLWEE
ncbi:MAG: RagB/SusD family nutrient uptake outer membrane protein [Rikenellaceae bacterium]